MLFAGLFLKYDYLYIMLQVLFGYLNLERAQFFWFELIYIRLKLDVLLSDNLANHSAILKFSLVVNLSLPERFRALQSI